MSTGQFAFYIATITAEPVTWSSTAPTDADDSRPDPGSICISSGPSTSLVDQFSDQCFLLTWFLAYLVFARYKWMRRSHLSGRRPRSVWTGDNDNGTTPSRPRQLCAPVPHGTRTDLCVHHPFAGDSEINAVMGCDVLFTTLFTLIFTLYKALHTNTDKIDMHMVSLYTTLLGASYTHAIGLCWMYACACACGAALSHPHPRHTHVASPTLYLP